MQNPFPQSTLKTVKEALQSYYWKKAMDEEYSALMQNNMWSLVSSPPSRHIIGYKWVYRVKENLDDTVQSFKAYLIANVH